MNGSTPIVTSSSNIQEEDTVEYMETDSADEPSSSQTITLEDIEQVMKRPLNLGEYWYVVQKAWFDECTTYIKDGMNSPKPDPIDNSSLFVQVKNNAQKNSTEFLYQMKKSLNEGEDFVVVPEEVWNLLVETFKTVDGVGSNPIRCAVIETTKDSSYLIVEFHPLELRLALYGTKEDMVVRYSRNCTLQKMVSDMRNIFRVSNDRPVQLWNNGTLLLPHSDNVTKTNSNMVLMNNINTTNNALTSSSSTLSPTSKISIPPPPPPPPSPSGQRQNCANGKVNGVLDQRLSDFDLEQNTVLTLEVQNLDGTWPSSRTKHGAITRSMVSSGVPLTPPGVCGLMNLGNTCFMNSALQCLSNTQPLTEFLLSDKYLEDINPDNPLGMGGEIVRRYAELIKAIWSGYHVTLSPRDFKIAVSRFAPQFSGFAQHDCQELMAFLLDGLHEDLNRVKDKPYIEIKTEIDKRPDEEVANESWQNYKRRNDSIIVDTFHSQLKSTLVCPDCSLVSVTFDPFCYLTLPLPFKRERAVDIIFVPAISKRPIHAVSINKRNYSSTYSSSLKDMVELPVRSIKMENVMIPKTGITSEISASVAKVFNETCDSNGSLVLNRQLDPRKLRVVNVFINRLNKICSPDEVYSVHFEDIIVYEEDDCPVSTAVDSVLQTQQSVASKYLGNVMPVFIRESSPTSSETSIQSISRPFLINIKSLTYENIREAIFQELVSLVIPEETESFLQAMNEIVPKEEKPTNAMNKRQTAASLRDGSDGEASSELDEEGETTIDLQDEVDAKGFDGEYSSKNESNDDESGYNTQNRNSPPFTISIVNMYATSEFSVLQPGVPIESSSNIFLAININTKIVTKYFPKELNEWKQVKLSSMVPSLGSKLQNVKPWITLDECINQFTLVEKLGSDDPWYCPRCKKHQMASKKFDIWSLPNILIIHLKRFSYNRIHRDKLDVLVSFPIKNLDMTPYVMHNPINEKFHYNLIGVANHFGGLGGGHYTAFAKNAKNQRWYNFDDSSVSAVSENDAITKNAYVLFYERHHHPENSDVKMSDIADSNDQVNKDETTA
ncbi:hypothetical protein RDWZM_005597 [Blomia tropicalis]|uniref:ubiquitinyl hydrolase 1 n=1 Tax=Blomia tropicalis TaxID=40697 RepID=A0A9Q0M9T4_BLOTA|nr:hypothetical protein RDWZM_005597 [Blomia tropicalis]